MPLYALTGGLLIEYSVSEKFKMQTGLLYSGKGGRFNFDGEILKDNLNYLQVPVIFKPAIFSSTLNNSLFLNIGATYNQLVSAKFDNEDYSSAVEDTDYGVLIGLELDLTPNLQLGTTGEIGLR